MKILTVFGTRPEAIKMVPLIYECAGHEGIENIICCTGQHQEMVRQVLDLFDIEPDYNLEVMTGGQDLFHITREALSGLEEVMAEENPDLVLVQGDTTTTFTGALAAFYKKKKIGHLEAGLRSYDKDAPYPEEANRRFTSCIADFHFAPSDQARQNLLKEKVPGEKIFVTGNTGIDALMYVAGKLEGHALEQLPAIFPTFNVSPLNDLAPIFARENKKIILVTGHRRENFGQDLENVCLALRQLSSRPDLEIIYPVHLNPRVQEPVYKLLGGVDNIHLLPPLDYLSFVFLMTRSYLILTDSGGIQEEAPSLGKPVLVMRKVTERPEALAGGGVMLVGTGKERVIGHITRLLESRDVYSDMARVRNPYGDGTAAKRILQIIRREFNV